MTGYCKHYTTIAATSRMMFGVWSSVLAVILICGSGYSQRLIETSKTNDTNTTYIGIANTTSFGLQSIITAKFLGIPFALPPKRFAKPELATPKEEEFEATKFGNICPQYEAKREECDQNMSEDCLYLNIYVPLPDLTQLDLVVPSTAFTSSSTASTSGSTDSTSVRTASNSSSTASTSGSTASTSGSTASMATTNNSESQSRNSSSETNLHLNSTRRYAVLIFIHGGAFVVGSGNCNDGSVLAGHGNIIVVAINYRLGNFGFLSTNDGVIPGNLGLWDQHVAIQWVKNNIHIFGGDPNRITLGGQSAGSYSSIYQALYQGNEKLFQRVIAQSGTPAAVKSASTVGLSSTLEVARRLNCTISGTTQAVKACLMNRTVNDLINVRLPMIVPGSLPVQPTVDGTLIAKDPYLVLSQMASTTPVNRLNVPSHFISKDLLIGLDRHDGDVVLRLYAVILSGGNNTLFNQILTSVIDPDHFKEFIRNYFQQNVRDVVDEIVIESVFDRYSDWQSPLDYFSLSNRVIDTLTDVFFALPSLDTASAHIQPYNPITTPASTTGTNNVSETDVKKTQGSTYVYRFSLPAPDYIIPWLNGTGHASEVPYVFGIGKKLDGDDLILSTAVITYWSNFVKSGDPNRGEPSQIGSEEANASLHQWQKYEDKNQWYLELAVNPTSKQRLRADYRHFWSQYIPQLRHHLQSVYNDGVKSVHPQPCPTMKPNGQAILRANVFDLLVLSVLAVTFAFLW